MERPLKEVDMLRHELKALRYILENLHGGRMVATDLPAREDFQSEQGRELYDAIVKAKDRATAQAAVARLDLEGVDLQSFLRLSADHYYTYPALVKERAAAIRSGTLKVETT
ncbi:MAG TPA: hypothetical protein VKB84_00560 [Candidatus Binataceae bacterium]|nr:hypothetical protein [Candidatus Binataceae bacterium]